MILLLDFNINYHSRFTAVLVFLKFTDIGDVYQHELSIKFDSSSENGLNDHCGVYDQGSFDG